MAEILCVKNGRAIVVCGFLMKSSLKYMLKVWKKLWEPFGSCLLNSTANPAHFHPSLVGLAVLYSRQLPNGSHDFFQTFSIHFKDDFIKNPQTTIALPFLTHNISAIGGVHHGNNLIFESPFFLHSWRFNYSGSRSFSENIHLLSSL